MMNNRKKNKQAMPPTTPSSRKKIGPTQSSTPGPGNTTTTTSNNDTWSNLRRNYERFTKLGSFLDITQSPKISDVEIIVCFADIRGFTSYCNALQKISLDNRIQNFLRDYLNIYALSVLKEIWKIEPEETNESISQENATLRSLIVPVTYKNLGDGVMLVWEIPPNIPIVIQGKITHKIMNVLMNIFSSFEKWYRNPGLVEIDAYSERVKDLKLGFGIARGHAWKLDFGHHLKFDYAGSVVNLASRLQDKARPEGIVAQYDFSQSLFDALIKKKIGIVKTITAVKGLGPQKVMVLTGDETRTLSNA